MKIEFWSMGKDHEKYVKEGIELFTKRVKNYYTTTWKIIGPPKNAASLPDEILKEKEGEIILNKLEKTDFLILLDETGKQLTSPGLALLLDQRAIQGTRNIVFLIGGAFGVSKAVMARANFSWGLSTLVFPHQLVRLILAEQVYRACTILKNEKYHHM